LVLENKNRYELLKGLPAARSTLLAVMKPLDPALEMLEVKIVRLESTETFVFLR
jgi:hypothetical protein